MHTLWQCRTMVVMKVMFTFIPNVKEQSNTMRHKGDELNCVNVESYLTVNNKQVVYLAIGLIFNIWNKPETSFSCFVFFKSHKILLLTYFLTFCSSCNRTHSWYKLHPSQLMEIRLSHWRLVFPQICLASFSDGCVHILQGQQNIVNTPISVNNTPKVTVFYSSRESQY